MLAADIMDIAPFLPQMLVAIALTGMTLALFWTQISGNPPKARVKAALGQRVGKAQSAKNAKPALRREAKPIFRRIVEAFNMTDRLNDGKIVNRLRMAGYRGHAPVISYLAFLVLVPAIMTAIAAFYVFMIFPPHHPLILKLGAVAIAGVAGTFLPSIYLTNRIQKRQLEIRRSWPDALDLLLICVESGMSIESALHKVSAELSDSCPALSEELLITTAELSYLQDRRMAYENLGKRTGLEGVRAVVTSLIQSEKYGTPLGTALRVLAQENRDMRMAEAEKKAAALPPKLTVPMILFFLPVLFAVIISPTIIQYVSG